MQLSHGTILVTATILPAYNLALRHIGQPPVREIRVQRIPGPPFPSPPRELVLHLFNPLVDWRLQIPEMQTGQRQDLQLPLGQLESRSLESIVRCEETQMNLTLGSKHHGARLFLLGPWHWPTFADARLSLAAYVIPGDARIRQVVAAAQALDPGIEDTREPVRLLAGIYQVLGSQQKIQYAEPELIQPAAGLSYQRIRNPSETLEGLGAGRGEGTCLDLSVIMAGALECAGQSAAIILLADAPDRFSHAVPAVWTRRAGYRRPRVADGNEIRDALLEGQLVPVESTGVCLGPGRLDFAAARTRALDLVRLSPIVECLSIEGCRHPMVRVLPLELSFDSVVVQAQLIAESLGDELQRPMLETLHLFYGVMAARGGLSREMFELLQLDADTILAQIREVLLRRPSSGTAGRTRGFERTLADARDGAGRRSSTTVAEEDLWRALLSPSSPNISVDQILNRQELNTKKLRETLDSLRPPPNNGQDTYDGSRAR